MNTLLQIPAEPALSSWPIAVLLISVAFIIVSITVFRLHAFLALIGGALLAGWLSAGSSAEMLQTIENVSKGFGNTAAGVGIVIALAAIIGMALMDSGAADRIVRGLMSAFGENRVAWALMLSGFLLSVPVFFDTVFFLLIPIACTLALRTGKNFVWYVMAMAAGGAITHSMVPPTPGPLLIADALSLDLGVAMMAGMFAAIPPAIVALFVAKWMDQRGPIPVRESAGISLEDMKTALEKPDDQLPGFWVSLLPVAFPALLLAGASIVSVLEKNGLMSLSEVPFLGGAIQVMGNKIIALTIGAIAALAILARQEKLSLKAMGERFSGPLEVAGVIILITSAGGAYGTIIRTSGIGELIQSYAEAYQLNYVLLAWLFTLFIRTAQGSATVAMITGAGLMAAIMGDGSALPYHPLYIYLAIGFGSIGGSWMNDSGFWVVGKLSGFTEKETLRTWTVMLTIISVVGLIPVLLFSWILPLK